jgi:hypothetical protein
MTRPAFVTNLMLLVGASVQFRCDGCGALLEAYGVPGGRTSGFSCGACKVPGRLVAALYNAKGAS